jgi:hypothetical protein
MTDAIAHFLRGPHDEASARHELASARAALLQARIALEEGRRGDALKIIRAATQSLKSMGAPHE